MIVATATYETGRPTIDSQVVTLRRAGADTFIIVAVEELAEQAINKAFDIGWTPVRYVTGVSQSISSTMTPAGREKLKGAITAVYDKDPTDARWRDDAGFMQYSAFTEKYMSRDEQDDARVVNGFGVAATMVHVLEQCRADLSRKNIMYQAANIDRPRIADVIARSENQHFREQLSSNTTNATCVVQWLKLGVVRGAAWRLGRRATPSGPPRGTSLRPRDAMVGLRSPRTDGVDVECSLQTRQDRHRS